MKRPPQHDFPQSRGEFQVHASGATLKFGDEAVRRGQMLDQMGCDDQVAAAIGNGEVASIGLDHRYGGKPHRFGAVQAAFERILLEDEIRPLKWTVASSNVYNEIIELNFNLADCFRA